MNSIQVPDLPRSNSLTIGQRLAECSQASGFDYLRLILALLVVCWHSSLLTLGDAVTTKSYVFTTPALGFGLMILPMFFALSGFLVAGSYYRVRSLMVFLSLRGLRIIPALMVETCLSAIILGPVFTTFDLHQYFTSPEFYSYWLNIIGYIHFTLPGVFTTLPLPVVNVQLWIIPYEFTCYLIIAFAGVTTILFRPRVGIYLVIALILYCIGFQTSTLDARPPGFLLVLSGLMGVALYVYSDKIRLSRTLFFASLALAIGLLDLSLLPSLRSASPVGSQPSPLAFMPHVALCLSSAPIAYATVYLGLCNPPRLAIIRSGDYSYGIFLYSFPIQQVCLLLVRSIFLSTHFPHIQHFLYSVRDRPWTTNILLSCPIIFMWAFLSWHLVEWPILSRKRKIITKLSEILKTIQGLWKN